MNKRTCNTATQITYMFVHVYVVQIGVLKGPVVLHFLKVANLGYLFPDLGVGFTHMFPILFF